MALNLFSNFGLRANHEQVQLLNKGGGRANCSALNPFMGILFLLSSSILISPGIEKADQVKDDGSDVLIRLKIGHATYFLHELTLPLD